MSEPGIPMDYDDIYGSEEEHIARLKLLLATMFESGDLDDELRLMEECKITLPLLFAMEERAKELAKELSQTNANLATARERIAELEDKIETYHLLPKGWHDVENFYKEEEVDEAGQSCGRCMICGLPYTIVRPGKAQPACDCEEG